MTGREAKIKYLECWFDRNDHFVRAYDVSDVNRAEYSFDVSDECVKSLVSDFSSADLDDIVEELNFKKWSLEVDLYNIEYKIFQTKMARAKKQHEETTRWEKDNGC